MQLALTDEQAAFRDEVREWLTAHVPHEPLAPQWTPNGLAAHREWERELQAAGYAALAWPAEYGGGGADLATQAIFQEQYILSGAPARLNRMGLGLIGPTLIELGTEEQRAQFLPRILSCEDLWCQGFSEPQAGSDLASLRTKAVRDGDDRVISGQKVWTSLAGFADWMFALVRTNPDAPKHRGITFVLIPMDSPGIDVRPIRQLHGEPGFAEVFLHEVRVPVANVVGAIDDGWSVAMACLGFERGTGLGDHVRFTTDVLGLVDLARQTGVADDPVVRDAIAARYVESQAFRCYMQHTLARLSAGDTAVSASVTKLTWSELEARIFATARDVLGERADLADAGDTAGTNLQRRYWHARGARIFAGANEIQRTIIAERTLGLPKEPR
jgi:alkylation response protein AidB-like acyl-CoA dehydrogenase